METAVKSWGKTRCSEAVLLLLAEEARLELVRARQTDVVALEEELVVLAAGPAEAVPRRGSVVPTLLKD